VTFGKSVFSKSLSITLLCGALYAQAPASKPASDRPAEGKLSERAMQRIVKEVRSELVMMPFYGVFDNLSFKIDGYTVILMGQVNRPTLKSEAENRVKRIEGVEKVVNQIEVLPLSPNDDRIRLGVYRAIYSHPTLQQYSLRAVPPIHIIVKNGNVTLEGFVAREADRTVANIQANQVPGVFTVTNNLQVDK
jgi:hyperosmotically inducible protein